MLSQTASNNADFQNFKASSNKQEWGDGSTKQYGSKLQIKMT